MSKLVAHRGASAQATENTIAAFDLAIQLKADFVEFDVLQTRDGVLIVRHDEYIDGRHISDIDYDTIVSDSRYRDIPTLAETLERVAGRTKLYVEIKCPGHEEAVVDMLHKYMNNNEFVIISFNDDVILKVKQYDPGIRTGLLLVHRINGKLVIRRQDIFHMRRVRASRADFIAPRCILVMATSIANAYRHDIPLYVWTVNNPRTFKFLSLLKKVETIASDIPATMTPDTMATYSRSRIIKKLVRSLTP